MKKKILILIYIILILIALKFLYSSILNSIIKDQYSKEIYDETKSKKLTYFNVFQPYIANYNYGNILYKNEKYEMAIEQYKKALKFYIPKYKECSIRINYALSICKLINVDETNKDSIHQAIQEYETAITVLTQKGCASNENNWHNKTAQQLKNDIESEIERLASLEKNDNDKSSSQDKEEIKNTQEEQSVEEKIQDIKQNATIRQSEIENKYKNNNSTMSTSIKNKNW